MLTRLAAVGTGGVLIAFETHLLCIESFSPVGILLSRHEGDTRVQSVEERCWSDLFVWTLIRIESFP